MSGHPEADQYEQYIEYLQMEFHESNRLAAESEQKVALVDIDETIAVFKAQEDGKSWIYKHLRLTNWGTSGYIIHIRGTKDGWEEDDTIICYIPNWLVLFELLDCFLPGKQPLFTSVADPKPL